MPPSFAFENFIWISLLIALAAIGLVLRSAKQVYRVVKAKNDVLLNSVFNAAPSKSDLSICMSRRVGATEPKVCSDIFAKMKKNQEKKGKKKEENIIAFPPPLLPFSRNCIQT